MKLKKQIEDYLERIYDSGYANGTYGEGENFNIIKHEFINFIYKNFKEKK